MKSFIIALSIIILTSCFKKHYLSSGQISKDYREVSVYHSILCEGNIDVFITHDTSYNVLVEAGANLMEYIETDVVNDQLIIRQLPSDIINTKAIKVYLNTDSLTSIKHLGSGDIDSDLINTTSINITLEGSGNIDTHINASTINTELIGSGNIEVLGNTNQLNCNLEGSGNIDCRYLNAALGNVSLNGSGNIRINVTDSLNVLLEGSGNIYYYENPYLTSQVSGSGNIIHL